jgi:hypothetical protein
MICQLTVTSGSGNNRVCGVFAFYLYQNFVLFWGLANTAQNKTDYKIESLCHIAFLVTFPTHMVLQFGRFLGSVYGCGVVSLSRDVISNTSSSEM